ncbi:MAG: nitrous oxide reductase accessory protein NosL [Flavipsychrobacter sp.]
MKTFLSIFCFTLIAGLSSCKQSFEPIDYGHDACMHCRMTIIDKRYAAEILTDKGKAYKFDDMGCLLKYISDNNLQVANAKIFVANYAAPANSFLDARVATYIHSELLKTPMNGNYAAFETKQNAGVPGSETNKLLSWSDLK